MSQADTPAHDDALLQTLWQSPYPATLQDESFRLVDVNDAYVAFTGRRREQLIGLDPLDLQPEADREVNRAQREALRPLTEAGDVPPMRRRMVDAAGRERWFMIVGRRVRAASGQPLWLSVVQDLTNEQRALDEGRRAQDELATWFELCPAGMLVFDDRGSVVRTNAAFEALIGRVLESLEQADADLRWLLGWEGGRSKGGGAPQPLVLERQATLRLPDGSRRRLLARVRQLPADGGRRRTMAVVEDRSAEEERDLARREIGVLMDTASVGVATFDPALGWLRTSALPPAAGVAASSPGRAALQGIGRDLVDAASMVEYDRLQVALKRRERVEVRYAINHPETGRRWLLTRVEPATPGQEGPGTLSVVTLDITDQELARQRNEQLLRELSTILEGSTAGIAYLRGGVLVRGNLRFERMLGFGAGESAGATLAEAFGRRFEPLAVERAVAAALAEGGTQDVELESRGSQGPAWLSLSVRAAPGPVSTPGAGGFEAVAVITDISRLKAQQRDLEAALRERELMFSLSDVGIAFMRGSRIERANQAMATLTGYSATELTALDGAELHASARACVEFEAAVAEGLRHSGRFTGERALRRRDGRQVWVQVAVRPVDEADPAAGVIASFVDVDERHQARLTLMQQAERTRAILDSVLVGIVTASERGIEWMNRSARRMFGGELADFVGEAIDVVATHDPAHPLRQSASFLQRLGEGQAETFECRLQARDGRQFWVVGSVVVTGRPASGPQLTFAFLDIERRRQAEVSIAQAQASLQRVIETAPLAIALFDARSLRVLQVNQRAGGFFGRPSETVQGQLLEDCMSEPRARALAEWLEAATLTPEVLHREWRDEAGPGGGEAAATVWDVRIVALAASDASAAQLLLVASDVTEQRAADQARLQAAITQRELLVREVHHRIKNNLQGVAGLLQHNASRHPELAVPLSEAVSQVQAIAQVYGLQVGSDGPLRVPTVFEAIAGSVSRTFGKAIVVAPSDPELQAWAFPEAEAIPIALVLNELLTNAVKHATGGPVRGAVDLLPAAEGEEGGPRVRLTLSHPGALGPGFDLQRVPGGVSGLGLVKALLPRRSASMTLECLGGEVITTVHLRGPSVRREGLATMSP